MIKEVVLRPCEQNRNEWPCDVYVLMEDGWHDKRFEDMVATFGIDLFERIFRGYDKDWIPRQWSMKDPSEKSHDL